MKEKCKRICTISSVILVLYLIVPFVTSVMAAVSGFKAGWESAEADPSTEPFWLLTLILIISVALIVIAIIPIVTAIQLLWGVRKADSPFTELNGKRIGTIGICFMLIEPLNFIYEAICNKVWDISEFNGLAFSAGLVLYCVSLIFRYGCELQQESDETI